MEKQAPTRRKNKVLGLAQNLRLFPWQEGQVEVSFNRRVSERGFPKGSQATLYLNEMKNSFSVKARAPKKGEVLPPVINEDGLEEQWAEKAFQYAETFLKLIKTVQNPSNLRLTR